MNLSKTTAALAAAAAVTGFGEGKLPAANGSVEIRSVDSYYANFRLHVPDNGSYALGYSHNLKDWYFNPPWSNITDGIYFYDAAPYYFGDIGHAFYQLRSWPEGDPSLKTNWVRLGDYSKGMRVMDRNGAQVLQVKDIVTSVQQDIATVTSAEGTITSYRALDEMIAYNVALSGHPDKTVLRSLTDPTNVITLEGTLLELNEVSSYPPGMLAVSVTRDLPASQGDVQYIEEWRLKMEDGHRVPYWYNESFSYTDGSIHDYNHQLVAVLRTPTGSDGKIEAKIKAFDLTGGFKNASLICDTNIGTYPAGTWLTVNTPLQYATQSTLVFSASGPGLAETVLIDPRRGLVARAPINCSSYYNTVNDAQIGIFGVDAAGKYAEAWFDANTYAALPPRTLPTSALVLEDFDGASALGQIYGNDNAYTFSTAVGQGMGGSNALRVDFIKTYPYPFIADPKGNDALDFSLYGGCSMQVKNLSANPLGFIIKFEHLCSNFSGGPCGWVEQTFTVPDSSDWTKLTLNFPQNGANIIPYFASRVLMFANPGQVNTSGSFLIDDMQLVPRAP